LRKFSRSCSFSTLMGELILLNQRRDDRSRSPRNSRPVFFFDLSCPFSYLAAERVERELGELEWVPVAAATTCRGRGDSDVDAIKTLAERRAIALRLRLVWPEQFPFKAPRALRAAALQLTADELRGRGMRRAAGLPRRAALAAGRA
jgi:2-hydroxychromene-2-carboxylate isomerase